MSQRSAFGVDPKTKAILNSLLTIENNYYDDPGTYEGLLKPANNLAPIVTSYHSTLTGQSQSGNGRRSQVRDMFYEPGGICLLQHLPKRRLPYKTRSAFVKVRPALIFRISSNAPQ
ncbi:MAG TPA: hypothetical protein VLH85_06130, partial [Levilinea sp.]|nr:hypothetical protein [Levilinea sp.]